MCFNYFLDFSVVILLMVTVATSFRSEYVSERSDDSEELDRVLF